jgi:biopolymer transport protein ExbD
MNFRSTTKADQPGFQIAPMMDIVFLLLCFFVATAVYSQWEYDVDIVLPTAQSGSVPDRLPGEVIINIGRDGAVSINQEPLDTDALSEKLTRLVTWFPGQPVVIRADKHTEYDHVMQVVDLCRQSDIWNISFATLGDEAGQR